MENELREQVALEYEYAAVDLERAAQHLRVTACHFRDGEVPRGCAHAWAAQGHIHNAETVLKALAVLHAERSQV